MVDVEYEEGKKRRKKMHLGKLSEGVVLCNVTVSKKIFKDVGCNCSNKLKGLSVKT